MTVEPIFTDDEDDEDDDIFPEFNWTSDILATAPTVPPVAIAHTAFSERDVLALEVCDDITTPELLVPLPESILSEAVLTYLEALEEIPPTDNVAAVSLLEPTPSLTPLGFLDIDISASSHLPVAHVESEEVPATSELPAIELSESTEDESCTSESSLSSPGGSSTSSSDDSSILLTPTLDAPALPAVAAEPSYPLLCGAFQDMPVYSAASLTSFASYPSAICPVVAPTAAAATPSPSQPILLPGGDAKRSTVIHTPMIPIAESQRAQIVRVFGDEADIDYTAEVDYDAEWEHFPTSTSDAERGRRRRFVDRLKRLSRLPKSLSRSF